MALSPLIDRLIEAFQVLPGVGPKGAQRMVLSVLQHNRPGGQMLAEVLADAVARVGECEDCRNLCEEAHCRLCTDPRRDDALLCVVESPADILAIERAGGFRGRYFVLHGHLSPIDGIGPEELGLDRLLERVRQLQPAEVILATNPTVEGETTALYVARRLQHLEVEVSRPASGIPVGGEVAAVDQLTLAQALLLRRKV